MPILTAGTYPAYFKRYIELVEAETPNKAIEKYSEVLNNFFLNISAEKQNYKYAEEKWTIKEVIQHLIDAERVFAYRAMCIARKDKTPLPGFDENTYAAAVSKNVNDRSWESIINEFVAVRKSTDLLVETFNDEQLQEAGITNGQPTNANTIAFVIFGHLIHHKKIIEERYL